MRCHAALSDWELDKATGFGYGNKDFEKRTHRTVTYEVWGVFLLMVVS